MCQGDDAGWREQELEGKRKATLCLCSLTRIVSFLCSGTENGPLGSNFEIREESTIRQMPVNRAWAIQPTAKVDHGSHYVIVLTIGTRLQLSENSC